MVGVAAAGTGFGADPGVAVGFGASGMAVTGLVWIGGAAGRDGGAVAAGLGAGTAAGFCGPAPDFEAGAAAAGFVLAGGGGPKVIRGRNGSEEIRGRETGRLSGAMAGEILA